MKYILSTLFSFVPTLVFAAKLNNPLGGNQSLEKVVTAVLTVVSTIGAVLVVLAIIYAGFLFVTAQGNSDKINDAKKIFLWTVVGAIVLLGAEVLSKIIMETAKELK
jgi:hypothetical protein